MRHKRVKGPRARRGDSKELEDFAGDMIELMSSIYRNQVIKAMNKGTIEKFEDVQVGNFSSVFLKLANAVTRKMKNRFSNKKIQGVSRSKLGKLDKRTKKAFHGRVEKIIGIDTGELSAKEAMKPTTNALMEETARWIQGTRDETLEFYTKNTLRAMAQGSSINEVLEQFDEMVEKRVGHARFVAFNQVQNFTAISTKIRAQNAGIEKAIWRTSEDEKVRPSHDDRKNKEFDLSKGLFSSKDGLWLLPGVDFNCR